MVLLFPDRSATEATFDRSRRHGALRNLPLLARPKPQPQWSSSSAAGKATEAETSLLVELGGEQSAVVAHGPFEPRLLVDLTQDMGNYHHHRQRRRNENLNENEQLTLRQRQLPPLRRPDYQFRSTPTPPQYCYCELNLSPLQGATHHYRFCFLPMLRPAQL